jgi:hypothetical protein
MLVRDLIRSTEWSPPRDPPSAKPAVSVLLPTFCRGASGLFRKAALSVLNQTLSALELIIVDDGSSDGTADQIQELMRDDPRVGCLRHPRNIGLPAVSEYEAYLRARADYLAFAFDDDEFYPDAIEQLLRFAQPRSWAMVHGHVEVRSYDEARSQAVTYSLGRAGAFPALLKGTNYIANASVLLHRRVVEKIGFFDPHVAVARLCDWDLWRRTAEAFRITGADVPVGVVTGPATEDSLERTYPLDLWLSHEHCAKPRNAQLVPGRMQDYDVLGAPPGLSAEGRLALDEIKQRFADRWWFPRPPAHVSGGREAASDGIPAGRLLVVTGSHDASTTLYFDHLPDPWRASVRFAYPGQFHPQEMLGASAIIFVRHLTNITGLRPWIDLAAALRIPHYYFLDDNFIVLANEPEHRDELATYSPDWVREQLRPFSGVLLSTQPLLEYFKAESLHPNLMLFPPLAFRPSIEDADAFPPKESGSLRVAFFGGAHRVGPFAEFVVPALMRAAREVPLEVIAAGNGEGLQGLKGVARVLTTPFEVAYDLALSRFVTAGIDVLCHPNSETANNPFKSLNVLISAWAMGALPLVSDGPPYDSVPGQEVAILCRNTAASWFRAIRRASREEDLKQHIADHLDRFCRERYDGRQNVDAIQRILRKHRPPGPLLRDARARKAMDLLRSGPVASAPVAQTTTPATMREPVMRTPVQVPHFGDRVAFRVPVGRGQWCGIDVDTGPEPGGGQTYKFALRLLSEKGICIRESVSSTPDGMGWLVFRFPAVVNSGGQTFRLELTPRPARTASPTARGHSTDVSSSAAWHHFRSTPRIAYRLLFQV